MKQIKTLEGIFSLDHNIRLYIPSTKDIDKKINNTGYRGFINEALTKFGSWFGGATSFKAIGSWVSTSKGLIVEKITIVESYCDNKAVEAHLKDVIAFAKRIKIELKQGAISLEYDNKLYFI